MLCAPLMQLYWALVLCLVELHRENCAFFRRASAEISLLLCDCTNVYAVLIRDAGEISLLIANDITKVVTMTKYMVVFNDAYAWCTVIVLLALFAEFADWCQTVFHSFWTASMRALVAERFSDCIALVPGTVSELLFLLTVAEQSFTVFELRACLLSLLNDAVIALLSSVCTIVILYDKYKDTTNWYGMYLSSVTG